MLKVILVDDNAIVRMGLSKIINWNSLGAEIVFSVGTGRMAIEYICKNDIDVVISDVKMPDGDGLELAKYIHENHPDILMILISAYGEFEYAQKAIRYNVKEYLTKPISTENISHIKRVISEYAINKRIEELKEKWSNSEFEWEVVDALRKKDEEQLMRVLDVGLDIETENIDVLKKYYLNILNFFFSIKSIKELKYIPKEEIIADIEETEDISNFDEYVKNVIHKCFELAVIDKSSLIMITEYIAEIIDKEYANPELSVAMIASKVGLDSKYVGTMFKSCKGVSILKYINSIRIEKSQELLKNTDLDINKIAEKVGFMNYRYFTTRFREVLGVTPSEFRSKSN